MSTCSNMVLEMLSIKPLYFLIPPTKYPAPGLNHFTGVRKEMVAVDRRRCKNV